MSQNYQRKQVQTNRRKSTTFPIFLNEQNEIDDNNRRLSICPSNFQRRLSTVSQLYLPNGNEYLPQQRIPPTGPEYQQTFILTNEENNYENFDDNKKRLSIISTYYPKIDQLNIEKNFEDELNNKNKIKNKILFIIEPILTGIIIFPILVLFWETGWNSSLIFLNTINNYSLNLHLDEGTHPDSEFYTWKSLIFTYLIVEILLLLYYLFQDIFYNFLKTKNFILKYILLKFHIFLLGIIYIFQWEMLWTIWDQFTPLEWYFELSLSLTSIFALIVFVGHLSDLVCSPFIFSYDSIEYCIQFGCPLLTRQV